MHIALQRSEGTPKGQANQLKSITQAHWLQISLRIFEGKFEVSVLV